MGTRIKTFVSTGIPPDGRLFAGDLNAIEDQYADLANLLQTLGVGTIQVGETGLQIIRYGPGEMRISGHLRTDGIMRALGGLYAGAFTTVQRDAIAAGFRPYGLVILNTNTNRLEINIGTDAAPSWTGLSASITRNTLGLRPGPAASNSGSWYFATDDNGGTLYYSDGTVWTKVARGLTQPLDANSVGTTQIADGAVTTAKHADSSVTLVKLDPNVPVIPLGMPCDWPWASGSIPAWALLPYGQLLTAAAYPAMQALADASGRPYGGVAATNFNLPDYRGRIGVGKDDMGGTLANRITAAISGVAGATLGAVFGSEGITLTTAQLPAHNHGITGTPTLSGVPGLTDPTHQHGGNTSNTDPFGQNISGWHFDDFAGTQNTGGGVNNVFSNAGHGTHSHPIPFGGTGIVLNAGTLAVSAGSLATANAGSGSVHQNTQPSIIVNKLIRVL